MVRGKEKEAINSVNDESQCSNRDKQYKVVPRLHGELDLERRLDTSEERSYYKYKINTIIQFQKTLFVWNRE